MEDKNPALQVEGVSKNFVLPHEKHGSAKSVFASVFRKGGKAQTQHALRDISFQVKKGEFFGIVGRNGSGKSTLLKILAGIYQPSKGSVKLDGRLVPFIELGVGFNPELTGRDNVFLNGALLGYSRKEISAMYNDIVKFAELEGFMEQKLKNYSSGMQVRLAFSLATRADAEILLVDEVLAVGDAAFQRKCFEHFKELKAKKTTVILVTHDMNAVREYCDRAILIEKSKVLAQGNPDKVATTYTRMFMDEAAGAETQKAERWGDQAIRYTDIKVPKILKEHEDLIIKLTAVAEKDIDDPNFGFRIRNAADVHVLGTNTKIKQRKIAPMKRGDTITIEWRVPNVFSDGTCRIDPAIVYSSDTAVADWWEGAASFSVIKQERTGYVVNPDIACEVERKSAR